MNLPPLVLVVVFLALVGLTALVGVVMLGRALWQRARARRRIVEGEQDKPRVFRESPNEAQEKLRDIRLTCEYQAGGKIGLTPAQFALLMMLAEQGVKPS